ncbi:MAG: diacylglycerol kinase family lipid kinase [Pseudonocardia sp.]|uniref:diacylglycerol/lipid kinase family protein n=1 Tax=unclassified Pseudonocardia TaxID=2619320 RepID=UPI00086AB0B9|nr:MULTISPECIES: diacylglycerol kinase family protein [unclassified Pseudonocardia]MBN9108461.1 diacylglycerol kinase family lipid kinase [Pseudonocardia sp.]ODV07880.1 MAG: diacylglycerol kinase [Pseudonocardia sp. SCN 73-27]
MRALLVVNPQATSTTPAGRDVLAHALASELKLDVLLTDYRGHAAEVTEQAVADGIELVVALGGDGTVNEVVNGMLARGLPSDPASAPALAVVPGGSANVFARALGMPRDPMEATGTILNALEEQRSRFVGLGRTADRFFTFNAGLGLDAEVVAAVERARAQGLEATPMRYARTALREYWNERRRPPSMTVEIPGAAPLEGMRLTFVSNTDPWTYLDGRAVRLNPGASFTDGLALFALKDLGLPTITGVLRQALRPDGDPRGRHVARQDAVAWVKVRSDRPLALQIDGDHIGARTEMEFHAVPRALRVVV